MSLPGFYVSLTYHLLKIYITHDKVIRELKNF